MPYSKMTSSWFVVLATTVPESTAATAVARVSSVAITGSGCTSLMVTEAGKTNSAAGQAAPAWTETVAA